MSSRPAVTLFFFLPKEVYLALLFTIHSKDTSTLLSYSISSNVADPVVYVLLLGVAKL